MSAAEQLGSSAHPRTNEERFCPYHGGWIVLGDCPIVATSQTFNSQAGGTPRGQRGARRVAAPNLDSFLAGHGDGDDDVPETATPPAAAERAGGKVRMAASVITVGSTIQSSIDDQSRVVLALGPGYTKSRWRSAPMLPTVAEMALDSAGPKARPARACYKCRHPLPATIDQRDPYPVVLVGHTTASKTSTVVALIQEAGDRGPEAFGTDRLLPTGASEDYLYSLDQEIFSKFRQGKQLELTVPQHHPPIEFNTTLGRGGPTINLLLHDVSGEDLMDREMVLERAPAVLWSDALIFLYNPEHSPEWDDSGQRRQSTILNGIRDDLESRGDRDASGRPYKDPPLFMVLSKADLLTTRYGIAGRQYSDADVQRELRELGDGAVVEAARRFPNVHWLFLAPMPATGGGPQGIVELFSLLIEELK